MFGEHFFRLYPVVRIKLALNHHALPFAEQVRQNAFVADVTEPSAS